MLTFLVMIVVLSWGIGGKDLKSFSHRPLLLEHSSFLCHLGSAKSYGVVVQ